MKTVALIAVLFCSFASFGQDIVIDKRTGVKIIFTADGRIFPESWYSKRINAKGISIESNEYARSEKIIKDVLQHYPVKLVKSNLKNIYVLSHINFFGQSFGGTNSNSNIYLTNRGIVNGYTALYIEQLFHAEFSSILLRNHKHSFNESEWKKINPINFNYGNSGVDALKQNKDSQKFDKELNNLGFIYEYATSTIENDFNAFAKNLFSPKNGFYNLVETYDNIKNKRMLIIDFYNKLDASLTEEYFNKILYTTKYKKH
ncbi:MAG: hypothetical protein CL846_01935 [Crocinitomicaceae bacterium]|nr:hypothetical protein [Crocinitomicaceae bacterium]|tara:strand:- start:2326 stop:3102 length:777 start_codon:yes stop_codon:yes gene_type:complete